MQTILCNRPLKNSKFTPIVCFPRNQLFAHFLVLDIYYIIYCSVPSSYNSITERSFHKKVAWNIEFATIVFNFMSKFRRNEQIHLNGTGMVKVGCDICSKANVVVAALKGFNRTHCYFTRLNPKRKGPFYFCLPALLGIHRNLKQKEFFYSRKGFFRKSPFCTFSCINPGFGQPWDMLWIFFLIVIFIMLQKNAFGQKKFKFHARIQ